jgi:hypothetical protein
MDDSKNEKWAPGLPYIDNIRLVLLTAAINAAAAFLFFWGKPLTLRDILADACICGITTSFIDVFVVSGRVQKLRSQGLLPKEVPQSRLMAGMPKNPLLFATLLGAVFGLMSPLFNALVIRFYEVETFAFAPFAVWRTLYTCALSAKIVEMSILRYVQPDCASISDLTGRSDETVRDPFPRVSTVRQWYNTVTDDFGFNLLFGLLVGGTVVQDHLVIIPPITRDSIAIAALILGVVVTARMAYPVAKSMRDARESGGLPISRVEDKRIGWIPYSPAKFALILLLPIMGVSLLAFWATLSFFGFEALDFFQFFFIRMLFISLLTKPVVKLAILRYTQPEATGK